MAVCIVMKMPMNRAATSAMAANVNWLALRSPAGVVVDDGLAVYHAGDTALFNDMSLIHELYHPKVALLPIGGRFTMDAAAAVMATKLLKPEIVIPMHYNTFDVIKADPWKFQKMVEDETDSEAVVLEPGDSIDV
jgi:L-ascorbate metabolism protein UlaG (beta-lactamase superfamily)